MLLVVMFGFGCKFSTDAEPQLSAPTVDSVNKKTEPAVEKNAETQTVALRGVV